MRRVCQETLLRKHLKITFKASYFEVAFFAPYWRNTFMDLIWRSLLNVFNTDRRNHFYEVLISVAILDHWRRESYCFSRSIPAKCTCISYISFFAILNSNIGKFRQS